MQSGIFHPAEITGAACGQGVALSGHERDTRCTFSLHFADARAMIRFGERCAEEGYRLFRERVARERLACEIPEG